MKSQWQQQYGELQTVRYDDSWRLEDLAYIEKLRDQKQYFIKRYLKRANKHDEWGEFLHLLVETIEEWTNDEIRRYKARYNSKGGKVSPKISW